jgi:hypothetical protein
MKALRLILLLFVTAVCLISSSCERGPLEIEEWVVEGVEYHEETGKLIVRIGNYNIESCGYSKYENAREYTDFSELIAIEDRTIGYTDETDITVSSIYFDSVTPPLTQYWMKELRLSLIPKHGSTGGKSGGEVVNPVQSAGLSLRQRRSHFTDNTKIHNLLLPCKSILYNKPPAFP